jgi:hypothetical protein
MWVYDGEEWTQDDGSYEPSAPKAPAPRQHWPAELVPELQVIEIVQPVPRTTRDIPPLPLP